MFRIRVATIEDSLGIAHVQVDSYHTAYADVFPDSYLAQFTYAEECSDWQEIITAGGAQILLVADSPADGIVGYAFCKVGMGAFLGCDAELVAMHVCRTHQRRGVGRGLLRESVARLRAQGCRSMMLWTLIDKPAQAWYERLGGQRVDEKRYHVEACEIAEVAYAWEDLTALNFRFGAAHGADGRL